MKIKLHGIGLVLILSGIFTACENTGMVTDESSVQRYNLNDIQLLTRIDTKAGDWIYDGTPICSWIFPIDPDTDIEVEDGSLISIGVEPRSVSEPMNITIDQFWYTRNSVYFEFGPHGYVFLQSIEVATALSFWDISDYSEFEDMTFFHIVENKIDFPDDDEFIPVPSEVVDSLLIGEFEHFSKYAVGVLPGSD